MAGSAITCKAAVCWGIGEELKIEEIQVEAPKANEVRVKMLCASICHTDILCWKGHLLELYPRVLGHEGVGVVESIGEGVTELKEGDLVIPTYLGECQECDNCTYGKTNICFKYPFALHALMPDQTSRMSVIDKNGAKHQLYHSITCSTFSQFTVINVNYVLKIDPSLPPHHASLVSCGFSTGLGATFKVAEVEKGSTVAVFGLGGVGLGVVEGARLRGASKIIGVDLNDWKKDKGLVYGMTDFINPNDILSNKSKSISDAIKDLTGGLGVHYSFECTGVASLVSEALEATIPGRGVSVVLGAGHDRSISLSHGTLIAGRTVKGSIFGGIKPRSDLPSIVAKCLNKELHVDELVSHEVELDDINQAFQVLKQPDCLKVMIHIAS